jgi:glucan phosphoethanolaminetransferase (alkaline phosphatase superfamily)
LPTASMTCFASVVKRPRGRPYVSCASCTRCCLCMHMCSYTMCSQVHVYTMCSNRSCAMCSYIHTYIHMHTYMHAALPLACICIHTCRRHCRSLAMFPKVCVRCCMCVVRSCAAMPQLAASNIFETFQILVYGNNAIRRIARRCRNFLTYCCT